MFLRVAEPTISSLYLKKSKNSSAAFKSTKSPTALHIRSRVSSRVDVASGLNCTVLGWERHLNANSAYSERGGNNTTSSAKATPPLQRLLPPFIPLIGG